MMILTKIESKIKNKWLWLNMKYLALLFLINIGLSLIMLVIGLVFFNDKMDAVKHSSSWVDIFVNSSIIIIPLIIINTNYLLLRIGLTSKSPWKLMALKIVVVFLGIIIGTFVCAFIESGFTTFFPEIGVLNSDGNKMSFIPGVLMTNLFLGMIIGIPILTIQMRRQSIDLILKEKELELSSLHQLKTKAQLETLQAKINPHFLYNSLNSIASLAKVDPDKVEQMSIALSKFFRYSMKTSDSNYASIDEELEMVNTYLEIEKIRFDERLNYSVTSNANGDYLIPRFLIQPLVENAIKHGLSKITMQAVLKVNITETTNQLEISICDNGPDFPADLLMGFGLQSTYEKLNVLFPNQYTMQFINGNEKRIMIILKKLIKDEPTV